MSPTGQTADGWWEIGVQRTISLDQTSAWTLLRSVLDDDAVRSVRSETPGKVVRANYQPAGWADPSNAAATRASRRDGHDARSPP